MKLSKKSIIAIIIIATLVVAFAVLLSVFLLHNQDNRELYWDAKIKIVAFEEEIGEFTLEELLTYAQEREFEAVYKPSNMPPEKKTYTGIYLKDLVLALGIDLQNADDIRFTAFDGFQKIYDIEDVMDEGNVYIAYLVEDEPFIEGISASANSSQEDGGPFVVIKAKDDFSQNRVKLLVEIKIR